MRILVGMSGGVDSSYVAMKLLDEGHSVEGAILVMHEYTEIESARIVADSLSIPLHVIDARDAFANEVIPNFVSEYALARTPNPCIICNGSVKFKLLNDFAEQNGFDAVATGHYARIAEIPTPSGIRYAPAVAKDLKKDQSYMLWRLSQRVMSRLMLPLADMTKDEIRADAQRRGLSVADKRDSQEICFIPDGDYASFIEERNGKCPEGNFIDEEGRVLGKHRGIIHYTVGQRKGLGIAMGARIFVTKISPQDNTVTLSYNSGTVSKFRVSGILYSGIEPRMTSDELALFVKVRYQSPLTECRVKFLSNEECEVTLGVPQRAVTAGQSAVFYVDGSVAFGGFIESVFQSE